MVTKFLSKPDSFDSISWVMGESGLDSGALCWDARRCWCCIHMTQPANFQDISQDKNPFTINNLCSSACMLIKEENDIIYFGP